MEFDKNSDIIHNICLVQIKSTDNSIDLPDLTTVYHTPSKITLTKSSSLTSPGTIHKKKLTLSFPGLSNSDFDKFNDLVRGNYQILYKLDNNDIYELSDIKFPMECKISYSVNKGHTLAFTSSSPIPIKFRDNQLPDGINYTGFNYDFDFYLS